MDDRVNECELCFCFLLKGGRGDAVVLALREGDEKNPDLRNCSSHLRQIDRS